MNKTLEAPRYTNRPIGSILALSRALGLPPDHLRELAERANQLYRKAKPIQKPDGTIRQPFDAIGPLKEFHARLKSRILVNVEFPDYLTGSVKGKDYIANAEIHKNSRIIICEDIANFFPSVKTPVVFDVWRYFFGFPEEVAKLLTKLTTKDGALPQGAIPSSYLANVALWRREPAVKVIFDGQGIRYSRYVDDIAISSSVPLTAEQQKHAIAQVYGMLANIGLRAKRKKHETQTSGGRMTTTKLVVNKKVSLPKAARSKIRSEVFRVEELSRDGVLGDDSMRLLNSVSVKVGQMMKLHPAAATALKLRLTHVRQAQRTMRAEASAKEPGSAPLVEAADFIEPAPWE